VSDIHNFTTLNKPQEEVYNERCNRFDCNNLATDEIKLRAGSFGIITLRVCKGCIDIFKKG